MTGDWDLIGFVVSSDYRKSVINELSEGPSTPSRLANRTETPIANISHALSQLRDRDCVELLVDEDQKKAASMDSPEEVPKFVETSKNDR